MYQLVLILIVTSTVMLPTIYLVLIYLTSPLSNQHRSKTKEESIINTAAMLLPERYERPIFSSCSHVKVESVKHIEKLYKCCYFICNFVLVTENKLNIDQCQPFEGWLHNFVAVEIHCSYISVLLSSISECRLFYSLLYRNVDCFTLFHEYIRI